MKKQELQALVDRSVRLLVEWYKGVCDIEGFRISVELAYSGGKDSDVCLRLMQMAEVPHVPVYKMTGIDPPYTIAHCRSVDAVVLAPKQRFFSLIAERGFPNRWQRFCCDVLKEYPVVKYVVMGVRKDESPARARRYTDYTECRNTRKGIVQALYPILDWTMQDVADFVEAERIVCHPLYYEDGVFHPERRLGCIGCPLQSQRSRRAQFGKWPGFLREWLRNGDIWWEKKPNVQAIFPSAAHIMALNLLCSSRKEYDDFDFQRMPKEDVERYLYLRCNQEYLRECRK